MAASVKSLTVLRCQLISPSLRRITLGGADLGDFPAACASGYIKILLPADEKKIRSAATVKRSFTIRAFRAAPGELDIDFIVHTQGGPASSWSNNARVRDVISVMGPGPTKLADPVADWFAFFGDLSALPAIAVNLENLPSTAVGVVFLEVPLADDCRELIALAGIKINWLIEENPALGSKALIESLYNMQWMKGSPYIWVAGEFQLMRSARKYLRACRKSLTGSYVSSYWKYGASQEGLRRAKALETAISKVKQLTS
jgi:NADPH-dependent ferric siderophore reductase